MLCVVYVVFVEKFAKNVIKKEKAAAAEDADVVLVAQKDLSKENINNNNVLIALIMSWSNHQH